MYYLPLQFKLISKFAPHSNQDVQDELRKEIFEVIGKEKQPSLSDRIKMPYTEATILEIQRQAIIGKVEDKFKFKRYMYLYL